MAENRRMSDCLIFLTRSANGRSTRWLLVASRPFFQSGCTPDCYKVPKYKSFAGREQTGWQSPNGPGRAPHRKREAPSENDASPSFEALNACCRLRPDEVRPHHLVILVLDDVAMPDVQPGNVEQGFNGGSLTRIGNDRVLVARLPGFGTLVAPPITSRPSTSKGTRCRWIGWASAVKL